MKKQDYGNHVIRPRTQGYREVMYTAKANTVLVVPLWEGGRSGERFREFGECRGEVPSGVRLTNTVALAALRSRRYLSRYFSFWLLFGSFFILTLPDCAGARSDGGRPPGRLMARPRCGASQARPASTPGRGAAGRWTRRVCAGRSGP